MSDVREHFKSKLHIDAVTTGENADAGEAVIKSELSDRVVARIYGVTPEHAEAVAEDWLRSLAATAAFGVANLREAIPSGLAALERNARALDALAGGLPAPDRHPGGGYGYLVPWTPEQAGTYRRRLGETTYSRFCIWAVMSFSAGGSPTMEDAVLAAADAIGLEGA